MSEAKTTELKWEKIRPTEQTRSRLDRAATEVTPISGGSFHVVRHPFGRIIAEASHDKEEILVGEIDLKALEDTRRNWPFLRDRRIDSYAPISNRMID